MRETIDARLLFCLCECVTNSENTIIECMSAGTHDNSIFSSCCCCSATHFFVDSVAQRQAHFHRIHDCHYFYCHRDHSNIKPQKTIEYSFLFTVVTITHSRTLETKRAAHQTSHVCIQIHLDGLFLLSVYFSVSFRLPRCYASCELYRFVYCFCIFTPFSFVAHAYTHTVARGECA